MLRAPIADRTVRAFIIAFLTAVMTLSSPVAAVSLETVGGVDVATDAARAAAVPPVQMPAGLLRTTDGRTLWEREPHEQRSMASITKIMTALVVLEKADFGETVVISANAAAVRESGVDLIAGERFTVEQLLEATLIPSANDAAYALAEHVAGSEDAFVALMNEKAADLGLGQTCFANPHGLDEPGHYTCAADIATLTQVAMADPRFAAIVGKPSITWTSGGVSKTYESSNKLLGSYEGMLGGKTGWTNRAGYSVVLTAERQGIQLVAVVLGGSSESDRFAQARALLDWGYAHYAMTQVASAETTAGLVPVSDYLDRTVTAAVSSDAVVPVFDLDGEVTSKLDLVSEIDAPVEVGDRLGTLTVVQGTRLLAQVPVVAAEDVAEPDAWDAIGIWFTRAWRTMFGGELQATPVRVM